MKVRRWIAIVVLLLWLIPFAITLIGVGMSGGAVLSPAALLREAAALDPAAIIRVGAWIVLAFPLLLMWWMAYPKGWKNKHG